MIRSTNIPLTIRRLTLDAARDNAPLDYSGLFIAIRDADTITTEVTIAFDRPDGQTVTLRRGQGFRHLGFNKLFITNTAQAGKWVDLVLAGDPGLVDKRLFDVLIPPASQSVTVAGFDTPVDVSDRAARLLGKAEVEPRQITVPADATGRFMLVNIASVVGTTVMDTVPANTKYIVEKAVVWKEAGTLSATILRVKNGAAIVADLRTRHPLQYDGWEGMVIPAGYTIEHNHNESASAAQVALWGRIEAA